MEFIRIVIKQQENLILYIAYFFKLIAVYFSLIHLFPYLKPLHNMYYISILLFGVLSLSVNECLTVVVV